MLITFKVSGFYDWEDVDKHPGTQVTDADVKALKAKQLINGGWSIKVEKTLDTHHDVNIPEISVCAHVAAQASVGKELTREDAVCHFLRESNKHHIARRHVKSVEVSDEGPNKELMQSALTRFGVTGAVADAAMDRYMEDNDAQTYIAGQFGPKASSKGSK
jgi:hypothetical protein